MAQGKGKYDGLCTALRVETQALAAAVIIVDGVLGNGFSLQAHESVSPKLLAKLLRAVADDLDADPEAG